MSNSKFKVGDWVIYERYAGMAVTQNPGAYLPVDGAIGRIAALSGYDPDRYFITFLGGYHNGVAFTNSAEQQGWWASTTCLKKWEPEQEGAVR